MIEQLRKKIVDANDAYRSGNSIISDAEYDTLIDELTILSPNDELLTKVGHIVIDESRKVQVPIDMYSMNKIKTTSEIEDWCRRKGISTNELVIITPKYDGISLANNEVTKESCTRGDGKIGQRSNEHYKLINNHLNDSITDFEYTYGEVIIPKQVFIDKHSEDFANPRNLVAGLFNSKTINPILKDCDYIKYGAIPKDLNQFKTKQEIIDKLNLGQELKVDYHICKISDLSEELLVDLFHKFSTIYEIDGLILEINDLALQEDLGRETSSNNPCYSRAFKHHSFEQSGETEVIGITWNISKQGYLKPIIHVNPIRLDGVTVSNITGNNARYVKDLGIGIGSRVIVKRSGMVIPLIVNVVNKVDFVMPDVPNIDWNSNGIELITLTETDDQKIKKIVAFFDILGADNVSEGIIFQLWEAGYTTIASILNLTTDDLEKINRFGKRKSSIVFDSIKKCTSNVSLSKLQHASGIFGGSLGSKKLALLEHFKEKPSIDRVMEIDGFADLSAKAYLDNYDLFYDFIKDLPITIEEKIEVVRTSNDLEGHQYVFTGIRRKDIEELIEMRGGKITGSVSKNTTHLIMKVTGSGSSKELKAIDLGIKILTIEELENLLM